MNYTRKRALLACDFCRHRKRRCDGQRPCSTCRDSNADCVYKELPYDRIEDASPSAVVDRLARIEALLEHQSHQLSRLGSGSSPPSVPPSRPDYFESTLFSLPQGYLEPSSMAIDSGHESAPFLIPKGHTTVASTLLSVPRVQALLGDYPREYFYNIESSMPPPEAIRNLQDSIKWPPIRREAVEPLVEQYYRDHHPQFPLFGPQTFKVWHEKLLETGPKQDLETAICLLVYAVGAVSTQKANSETHNQALALAFIAPALKIVLHHSIWSFKPCLELCQALLLAGSYFIQLSRPLHCWRMISLASQKFLHYLDLSKRQFPYADCTDAELRVFWLCFIYESNRMSELDVPRSGIEPLADKMPLPTHLELESEEHAILFIAEMAMRRLQNRIHSALYSPDGDGLVAGGASGIESAGSSWHIQNLQRLLALSGELHRQLEEWYSSMPEDVRPPRGMEPIASPRRKVLRIRYYAAQHIIHRPFVLYVVQQQQRSRSSTPSSMDPELYSTVPAVVLDQCEVCIDSSLKYLYNAVEMLDVRSSNLWSFSQSCMASLIILMLAEGAPQLRKYVPNVRPIRDLVVEKLSKWATKGSTFEAEVAILRSLVFSDTPAA